MSDAPIYIYLTHEVTVTLRLDTTRDDVQAALSRSGIVPGQLIGETLVVDVDVTEVLV